MKANCVGRLEDLKAGLIDVVPKWYDVEYRAR